MKEINHLVLAAQDLEAVRATYGALGFTLCPPGHHPFGTSNTAIQLERNYLELLAVTEPANVFAHTPSSYSFSAFNRDYLARHEGFSMLVLGTDNARDDLARWSSAGIETYEPFDFSRPARMANGDDVTVGFTLAFATNPAPALDRHLLLPAPRPRLFRAARIPASCERGARSSRMSGSAARMPKSWPAISRRSPTRRRRNWTTAPNFQPLPERSSSPKPKRSSAPSACRRLIRKTVRTSPATRSTAAASISSPGETSLGSASGLSFRRSTASGLRWHSYRSARADKR